MDREYEQGKERYRHAFIEGSLAAAFLGCFQYLRFEEGDVVSSTFESKKVMLFPVPSIPRRWCCFQYLRVEEGDKLANMRLVPVFVQFYQTIENGVTVFASIAALMYVPFSSGEQLGFESTRLLNSAICYEWKRVADVRENLNRVQWFS